MFESSNTVTKVTLSSARSRTIQNGGADDVSSESRLVLLSPQIILNKWNLTGTESLLMHIHCLLDTPGHYVLHPCYTAPTSTGRISWVCDVGGVGFMGRGYTIHTNPGRRQSSTWVGESVFYATPYSYSNNLPPPK